MSVTELRHGVVRCGAAIVACPRGWVAFAQADDAWLAIRGMSHRLSLAPTIQRRCCCRGSTRRALQCRRPCVRATWVASPGRVPGSDWESGKIKSAVSLNSAERSSPPVDALRSQRHVRDQESTSRSKLTPAAAAVSGRRRASSMAVAPALKPALGHRWRGRVQARHAPQLDQPLHESRGGAARS
jgi:hypothetical protein